MTGGCPKREIIWSARSATTEWHTDLPTVCWISGVFSVPQLLEFHQAKMWIWLNSIRIRRNKPDNNKGGQFWHGYEHVTVMSLAGLNIEYMSFQTRTTPRELNHPTTCWVAKLPLCLWTESLYLERKFDSVHVPAQTFYQNRFLFILAVSYSQGFRKSNMSPAAGKFRISQPLDPFLW